MEEVKVRWTGAAGIEFTYGGRTVLIDPYHSKPGKFEILFKRLRPRIDAIARYLDGLPGELSAIIVGHTHFDHALDIPEFSKHFDGPVVGSRSLDTLMTIHGTRGRVAVCEGRERVDLPGGAVVTMIPSAHGLVALGRVPCAGDIDPAARPPLRFSEYRLGTVFMPKLEIGGKVFMHAGSANFVESEADGHRCDVLFMCVPGWKKAPGYSTRLPEIVKPKVVVPFHFDDFSARMPADMRARVVPFQDMPGFLKRVSQSAPEAEIRLTRIFETMTF